MAQTFLQRILGITPSPRLGNVITVDDVNGIDISGVRGGFPFKTISAAITASLSNDLIYVLPGIYNLTSGIVIPDNVSIRGISVGTTIIQMLNVVTDTTLITLGNNSRLEDLTLILTSSGHHTLKGILYTGTTPAASKIRTTVITIDNSTASDIGISNVIGIHDISTELPGREITAVRATTIKISSAGLGSKRGILLDTSPSNFNFRDANIIVTRTGVGAGTYIGVEVNEIGSRILYDTGNISGFTADISETSGILEIGSVNLINANSNGLGFTPVGGASYATYADEGSLPAGTNFMKPGTAPPDANEIKVRVSRKLIVYSMSVKSIVAPGGVVVDTFILRKNGIDTTLVLTLTGVAIGNSTQAFGISFLPGDDISIKVVRGVGSNTANTCVAIDFY